MASTFLPLLAKILAMTPARVVFPTPPFPEIAIFIMSFLLKIIKMDSRVHGFEDSNICFVTIS
jgi:hypothetical protein